MTEAIWYFDFISPFAYLQFSRLSQLPADPEMVRLSNMPMGVRRDGG